MTIATTPTTPTRSRRRRIAGVAALAASLAVLAGCTAPHPDVTFYSNRTAVEIGPALWCNADMSQALTLEQRCGEYDGSDADRFARLEVRPGDPVQINVPTEVAEQPWSVYFRYVDADGQLGDGATELFDDGRLAYTLRPFADTDRFVLVAVRSGFTVVPNDGSVTDSTGVGFVETQGWGLFMSEAPAPDPTGEADGQP
ncbi:DUF2771 family protein [Nakamurella leprariae]|uniref:DUF2771 family protein n=1 Tax=Nakamurella leprariae TaxID=2803911 RepID=A0A938YB56_9ACTN|nr:DUF2771 family protein [Nakamurella leprariae]MBM9466393.1 DUF2771 family protein [Nakamurella leprariae]